MCYAGYSEGNQQKCSDLEANEKILKMITGKMFVDRNTPTLGIL
jgi:hypothetical protein